MNYFLMLPLWRFYCVTPVQINFHYVEKSRLYINQESLDKHEGQGQ